MTGRKKSVNGSVIRLPRRGNLGRAIGFQSKFSFGLGPDASTWRSGTISFNPF